MTYHMLRNHPSLFVCNRLFNIATLQVWCHSDKRNTKHNVSHMILLFELAVVTVTPPLETFWAADTLYCLPPLIVVILRLLLMTVGPLTELGTGTRLICWLELSRVMLLWRPPTDPTRLPPTVRSKVKVRNLFNLLIFQLTTYLVMESKHLTPLTQNSATIRHSNQIHTNKTQYLMIHLNINLIVWNFNLTQWWRLIL